MATYKVIQDIEAEDKFVGPLTLKQFIFAMGGVFFAWLSFFVTTKGIPWAMIFFLPLCLFGFFMAFPWSKEQPTDVWLLAKIRFRFKPKKRIWNQTGMQELVTITAPKKIERVLTNDLSQKEVKSRLKTLADTIDSRGWAVKNASIQEALAHYTPASDRLVGPDVLPQQVPIENINSIPDMMDNQVVGSMISQNSSNRLSEAVDKMNRIRAGEPLESSGQSSVAISPPSDLYNEPVDIFSEEEISEQIKTKKKAGDAGTSHMSKLPVSTSAVAGDDAQNDNKKTEAKKAQAPMTDTPNPDIMNLAQNNDLNVATLARQAKKDKPDDGEVVISLH